MIILTILDEKMEKIRFLLNIISPKRMPFYFKSIFFAKFNNILILKRKFEGMISLPQGVILYKLASSLKKNSIIVEIGCYGGLSSAFILSGLKDNGFLYSIDPFDSNLRKQENLLKKSKDIIYKNAELKMLDKKPNKSSVSIKLRGMGFKNFKLLEGYSSEIVKKWNKKIDFLWIDGDHNYESVKKDFIEWSKFLKKGGIIAFDDANMKKNGSKYWNMGLIGPTKVVEEFIKKPNWIKINRVEAMVYGIKNY